MRRVNQGRPGWFLMLAFAAGLVSCSLIVDKEIKPAGIGGTCKSDGDCQGSSCERGICVAKCAADVDCPEPSKCFTGLCQMPLKVHGVWIGFSASGEGWTLTHKEGMDEALKSLPYVSFDASEGIGGPPTAEDMSKAIKDGAQVVIANSFDHGEYVTKAAQENPNVTFLWASGYPTLANLGAYWAHYEQAFYVAGKIAAKKSKTKHLCFMGSFITGEIVRHANAFAQGVRSEEEGKSAVVEMRWTGFWFDPNNDPTFTYTPDPKGALLKQSPTVGSYFKDKPLFAESYITAKLIDSGCDVLAHQTDSQRAGQLVEDLFQGGHLKDANGAPTAWVIASDNRYGWKNKQGNAMRSSLGATYWNWTPLYVRLLDDIHRRAWKSSFVNEPMSADPAESVVGFELNPVADFDDSMMRSIYTRVARDPWTKVFEGPLQSTGQREPLAAGAILAEDEWRRICWFVDGIVERTNPNDMNNETSPLRPAKVPDDTYKPPVVPDGTPATTAPEVILVPLGRDKGQGWNCKENSG